MPPHTATIHLPSTLPSAVADAIAVEAEQGPPGTTARVTAADDRVTIQVEAGDVRGLRAALQSMVRLADAALRVVEDRP